MNDIDLNFYIPFRALSTCFWATHGKPKLITHLKPVIIFFRQHPVFTKVSTLVLTS